MKVELDELSEFPSPEPGQSNGYGNVVPNLAFAAAISAALMEPDRFKSNIKLESDAAWPERALMALMSPAFIERELLTSPTMNPIDVLAVA